MTQHPLRIPPCVGSALRLTQPTLLSRGRMPQPVLETRDLTIRFGGHIAVDGVSAAFHAGTLTAIVGPNGAGKTTYFNLISGQRPASAGAVLIDGVEATKLGAARRAKLG